MKYLFETLKLDPFDTFYKTLKDMTKDCPLSKYQFPELTKLLYECLSSIVPNQDELLYIIKQDYLTKLKLKPKIFWDYNITKPERKIVYEYVSNKYNVNINDLYNQAHVERYNNKYFIVDYKNNTQYEIELPN